MLCQSCECLYINGVKCHEHDCPNAWMDDKRECLNCGFEFTPAWKTQQHCSQPCYNDYYGFPELDDLDLLPDSDD